MLTKTAIDHFGSKKKLAEALGIALPSLYSWTETVPKFRQIQLEKLTKGKLRASPGLLDVKTSPDAAP